MSRSFGRCYTWHMVDDHLGSQSFYITLYYCTFLKVLVALEKKESADQRADFRQPNSLGRGPSEPSEFTFAATLLQQI